MMQSSARLGQEHLALLLRDIFCDKEAGERIVCASRLDWTIVHPPLLTNGPTTAGYRVGETLALTGFPTISRADVAHFMVGTLNSPEWVRKRVIVGT
jgi:putative NADH-flavin reductase